MMVMEIFVVVNILKFINYYFCNKFYFIFLQDTNIDKSLVAVPLINKTLEDNPIYSTPILIIAGWFFI
jgi:hypothetical protein